VVRQAHGLAARERPAHRHLPWWAGLVVIARKRRIARSFRVFNLPLNTVGIVHPGCNAPRRECGGPPTPTDSDGYCCTLLLYRYEKGRFPRSEPASDLRWSEGDPNPAIGAFWQELAA
jgi:hypothetical protein